MQVKIKSFDVNMEVKSNGIEFEVRNPDGSAQIGDCYLTMTGLIWCKGKVGTGAGAHRCSSFVRYHRAGPVNLALSRLHLLR